MGNWTIVSKERTDTSGGNPKSFSVMLNMDNGTWSAFGPNLTLFLSKNSGKYGFADSGSERGLKLFAPNGDWLATFLTLIASSPVGATGQGETELAKFSWRLDSK